jgi:phosphatidylserine/phosphatidylglycerophosphate/cardiolipin synthase-like enzyme
VPEFTGNVHNLELALPFPAPDTGPGPWFAIGRTFGAVDSDALDVWIDDANQTTYDPPDGDPLTLHIRTLIAVTHGWLSFVAADQPVPRLRARDGSPIVVNDATLVLEVWSTLRASLDRMAEDGSYFAELTESDRGGRPALKYLLYENVDPTTLDDAIEKLIAEERPDPFFSTADRATMLQQFKSGEIRILARAGRVIGEAAAGDALPPAPQRPTTPGVNDSWRRLTFRAADRLGQLFDPGFFFRRVQELADIREPIALVDKTLIPSRPKVEAHALPGMTPRRLILDWRDEFGRPVAGARVSMSPATGAAGAFVTTDTRGLWIGPNLAPDDKPRELTEQTITADGEHSQLGTLPDAPSSGPTLIRNQMADDYLVVSAIDLGAWFPARPAPQSPSAEPLRRFSDGNRITALIDARRAYWYIYRAMRRTFRADDFTNVEEGGRPAVEGPPLADTTGHRLYIAGWRFGPELWLPDFAPEAAMDPDYNADAQMTAGPPFDPRGHLMGIVRAAIEADVDVRALLWHQQSQDPNHHTDNTAAVLFIDRPDGGHRGQAIRDGVGRTVGSHHQKAVVVQNEDGRVAFVGGIDLACGRWDTPEHLPEDPRAAAGRDNTNDGWHDTHAMIEGPAVDDVETNFRQRWNAHPDSALGGRTPVPARPPAEQLDGIPQATHFVQINRTIPTGVPHFSFVDINEGDDSARRGRINAILRAKRYVYIEEQYLTHFDQAEYDAVMLDPTAGVDPSRTIAGALRHRLTGPEPLDFVAILIPRKLDEEPRFANGVIYELRKRFITFLTRGLSDEQIRDKLLVFHLRNSSGQFTYVHAKNMIVDDLWASIGSSNLGYRSLTYDTEINCDVVDGQIVGGVRRYARNFRVELWRGHLHLGQGGGPLLVDPRRGFEMLRSASEGNLARPHMVVPYDPAFMGDDLGAPGAPPLYNPANPNHEIVRTHLIDPDGRQPDDPALDYFALIGLIS